MKDNVIAQPGLNGYDPETNARPPSAAKALYLSNTIGLCEMAYQPIHTLDSEGLPPPGVEYRLAHHFLARPDSAATRILYQLVGRQRRFSDLRGALNAGSDNTVTVALKTLRDEGLIEQRIDARKTPATYWYELNSLGIQVMFLMQHFALLESAQREPHHEPVGAHV